MKQENKRRACIDSIPTRLLRALCLACIGPGESSCTPRTLSIHRVRVMRERPEFNFEYSRDANLSSPLASDLPRYCRRTERRFLVCVSTALWLFASAAAKARSSILCGAILASLIGCSPSDGSVAHSGYQVAPETRNIATDKSHPCSAVIDDAKLLVLLGDACMKEYAVHRNIERAIHLYVIAADCGSLDAMVRLGGAYGDGRGVERNQNLSFMWYERAANGGDAAAMVLAAGCYQDGRGTPRDEGLAAIRYRRAAELGDVNALFMMGVMSEEGLGVAADIAEASRYYIAAAERGHPTAIYLVANMYAAGRGVNLDHEQAFTWYERGARLGDVDAMIGLVQSYWNGRGVARDRVRAYIWFVVSEIVRGTRDAEYERELRRDLDPLEIEDAVFQAGVIAKNLVPIGGR